MLCLIVLQLAMHQDGLDSAGAVTRAELICFLTVFLSCLTFFFKYKHIFMPLPATSPLPPNAQIYAHVM